MKKRILSIVLSIVMLVSLLPTTALAMPSHTDHCVCGAAHISIGDHTTETIKTFEAWKNAASLPSSGSYYLDTDVTLTATANITGELNLCLNGHSISGTQINTITVSSGAVLNICDCKGIGSISGTQRGIYNNSGTVNVYSGTVSATGTGSVNDIFGVYNSSGTVNVYGGTVSATGGKNIDCGIYNNPGTVNVYGGTISTTGSSTYAYGIRNNGGAVNVFDGEVRVTNSGTYGYGIENKKSGSTVIVSGGTISTTGTESGDGYGIYNNVGTFELSGAPTITGKTADIYLNDNTVTIGAGGLTYTSDKAISVKMNTPGTFTTGWTDKMGDVAYGNYFVSADPNLAVVKDTSGELKIAEAVTVSFNANSGSGTMDNVLVEKEGTYTLPSCTFTPPTGKQFAGWAQTAEGEVISEATITVSEDTTLYAVWEDAPAHSHPVCGATCAHDGTHSTLESWTELTASDVSNNGTLSLTDGTSYYLGEDITVTKTVAISGKINLCLNGKTITGTSTAAIQVYSGATLNICDCTTGGTAGKIENTNNSTDSGTTTYGIYNSGTVNVYGGTISATTTATTTTAGSGSGIYNYSGQVTVVGTGAVVSGTFYGIYNNSTNGTVSVSAGKVSGKYGIYNKGEVIVGGEIEVTGTDYGISNSGTVSISGGTVQATSSSGHGIYSTSGTVSVSGGIVQATGSNSRGISVSGGTVSVSDGTVSGLTYGVYASSTGDITISGGEVSARNSASNSNSYGVYRLGSGAVEITGGTVSGKHGVYLYGSGNVTVSGGTVTGNGSGIYGYGIYLHSSSTGAVSVSGGTVSGTAYGVYTTGNSSGSVTVSGVANISGAQSGILHYGKGTVTVSGGTVQSPQRVTGTTSSGIKILTGSGNVTVSGGTVSGMDYGIYNGGTLTLSNAPTITGDTADIHLDSGKIITISGALTYTEENAINVKMDSAGTFTSGWTTNMGSAADNYGSYFISANDGYIVQPDGNELKLAEPPAAETHTHDMSVACGNEAPVTYTAWDGMGTPSGNVYLTDDVTLADTLTISSGTVNMCLNGHNITNSSAAIEVKSGATLNICDCKDSGSISATASGSRGIENYGILTVYGGTVSGNTYGICNNYGGNVAVSGGTVSGGTGIENYGTLTVSGGSVTGTYDYGGYGISTYGTFKLSGAPAITGGSNSADVLIHAYQKVITIDGTLTYSTPISVKPYNGYSAFTEGWNDKMPTADHNAYFVPASGSYVFVESSDELKPAYTVTYDANGAASGSVPTDSSSPYSYSATVTVLGNTGGLAEEGYEFSGWNTKADGTGTHYAPDSTFTIYSNTTLYAVWKVPHIHEYTYAVNTENAAQVIESCTCGHEETATLEIDTSVSTVYNGSAITPITVTYSSGWVGDKNAAISYSNNTNAGTASGSVTIGGLTVTKSFTITKKSAEAPAAPTAQNSITYGAELSEVGLTVGWTWVDGNTVPTVQNSGFKAYYTPGDTSNYDWTQVEGWNATENRLECTVSVTVNAKQLTNPTLTLDVSSFTYDGSAKTPTVTVKDGTTELTKNTDYTVNYSDNTNAGTGKVTVTFTGNYSGSAEKSFTISKANQGVFAITDKPIVDIAYGGSFTLSTAGGSGDGAVSWTVTTGSQYAEIDESGKVTVNGVGAVTITATKAESTNYKTATDTYTFTSVKATPVLGTVAVSGTVKDTTAPADVVLTQTGTVAGEFKITDDAMLANKSTYNWTFTPTDTVNYTTITGTVEIEVADTQAPSATITVDTKEWKEKLNNITFGIFFDNTQTVTITYADNDNGSGIKTVQYLLSDAAITDFTNVSWNTYNGAFSINPDSKVVIYAKVTDYDGNSIIVNSNGIVLDKTAPVLSSITDGETYYGNKTFAVNDALAGVNAVTVDGTAVPLNNGEHTIVADNAQHTIVVTDNAGNATTYTVTVYKIYTVTYKADGQVVSSQSVNHGADATAPAIPTKDGYTQTAPYWDKDGKNITVDTEINAVYTINEYTVTYKADGQVVDTQTIEHGANATPPAVPAKEGYTQIAPVWDKDGKNITVDTEINAVYTVNKYTVTYVADGETISTQTIEHGADATAPAIPTKEGYTQTAPYWNKDGKNITADTEINAEYTINKYDVTFNSNGGNKVEGIDNVNHGTVIAEPTAPTKENATFAGWFSDSACTKAWNFAKDTVTADLTLYAKWSDVPVFHISGEVLEKTGDGENEKVTVSGATVELKLGTTLIATETTDENGLFYFGGQKAGDYNVVVTSGAKVVTVLVTLHDHDEAGLTVELPKTVTNSIVEHDPAADGKDSVAAGTLVGGLEDVATAVRSENQSAQKVEVKLTVADQPPVTGTPTAGTEAAKQAQQKAIQQKAGGKQLVFFDLSVVKTINGGEPEAITDTGNTLLEIRIPFDSGNKWGITIYRYHGDKAEALAAVREGSTTEGFWVGDDGYIHIYTKKFSTYAVGYTVPSYGYFVPVTPDTVTSADTFDAGIVVYVTMSMLAATGSAVVIGKKRKEEN